MKKNEKGLTLMALVVTIIVLLILAGTSITLFGQNGIIDKATYAREEYQIESYREGLNMKLTEIVSDQIQKGQATSKEKSFEEFEKKGYDTQQEGEGEDATLYIFDGGYAFKLVEDENQKQEVVRYGKSDLIRPKIKDITITPVDLENNDFGIRIDVNANRAEKFTYEYEVANSGEVGDLVKRKKQFAFGYVVQAANESEVIANKTNKSSITVNLSEIDRTSEICGTIKINVKAYNKANDYAELENSIGISKIFLDANGGEFEGGKTEYSLLTKTGNTLGSIRSKIFTPVAKYQGDTFETWQINYANVGDFDQRYINEEKLTLIAYWNEEGHQYQEIVIKAPTCTEDGISRYTCSDCGKVKTAATAKLGHNYKSTHKAATCTTDETTTYKCSKCNDTYSEIGELALGHLFSDKYTQDSSGNCQTQGSKSRHCTRTGCTAKTDVTSTGYGSHNDSLHYNLSSHWYQCSICNQTTFGPNSHSWSSIRTDVYGRKYKECTGCGCVIMDPSS